MFGSVGRFTPSEHYHVCIPPSQRFQEYRGFVAFFMDHCKKRSNTRSQAPGGSSLGASLLEGLRWEHPPLKQRLAEVSAFRQQHENLRSVLQAVLSDDDRTAVAEVQIATVECLVDR